MDRADGIDEASLYDRQIRLWGLEAQNRSASTSSPSHTSGILERTYDQGQEEADTLGRMRSSTVLVVSLKGVAHEIIKNLVLAGIGRLIVMDEENVTEEDLGTGFLFREEEGAVGQNVCFLFLSFFLLLKSPLSLNSLASFFSVCSCFKRRRRLA